MMSEGIRSGVNWMRLNGQSRTSASVWTSIVLPRPGTPSSSTWPLATKRAIASCRLTSSWPTMTDLTSVSIARARSEKSSTESSVGGRSSVGWAICPSYWIRLVPIGLG